MRVTLIFDGNHFYRNLETEAPHRVIDYDRLAQHCLSLISPEARLNAAHYYTLSANPQLQRFLDGLERRPGYFVHRIRSTENNVSTQIVADMVRMAAMDAFDVCVLLSNNSVLQPAVETVAHFGKPVWLASFGEPDNTALELAAYNTVNLSVALETFSTSRRQPISVSGTEMLFAQLIEAWRFFNHRDKVLARWYFEHKWKASGPCPPAGSERETMLAQLIHQGLVEVFEASVNNRVIIAVRPSNRNC